MRSWKFRFLFVFVIIVLFSCNGRQYIDPLNDVLYSNNLRYESFYPDKFDECGRIYYYSKILWILKLSSEIDQNSDLNHLFISYYERIKMASTKREFDSLLIEIINFVKSDEIVSDSFSCDLTGFNWVFDTNYFDGIVSNTLIGLLKFSDERLQNNKYITQSNIGTISLINGDYANELKPSEKIKVIGIADFWNFVNYFYVYKGLIVRDWDSVLYETIDEVLTSQDSITYNLLIMKMSASIDDSHVMVRSDVIDDKIFGRYVPNFFIKKIDDKFVITGYRLGKTFFKSDNFFKSGDILYSINDVPLNILFDSIQCYFSASNMCGKQRIVCPYLLSSFIRVNKLVLCRGTIWDTVVLSFYDYRELNKYSETMTVNSKNKIVVKKFGEVAYVDIDSLYYTNFNSNMEKLVQYEKVILDMRGYPNEDISSLIMAEFLPKKSNFFKSIYADINRPGQLKIYNGYEVGASNKFKHKRIIILVDEQTQSETEFLVMSLQCNDNVIVIGSKTAGAIGNVVFFDLPGGIEISMSGIGILYPDNKMVQQNGVHLDEEVVVKLSDIVENRDMILEKALELFN